MITARKESSARQKLILEAETIDCKKNRFETPVMIKVSKKRTFAVLNFALPSNPGGGVVNGSSAQEECLCRCSTLYYNLTEDFLWKKFY